MSSDRAFCLAWSQVSGVGPVLIRKLQQTFGSLEQAWSADLSSLKTVSGVGDRTLQAITKTRNTIHPPEFLEQHQQKNPTFWTYTDEDYPRLLKEISDPPIVLYYRGQPRMDELNGDRPAIAIVGTRDPSDYGKRWTHRLTKSLARHGFLVVSGMAEGIDTQAHRSCIEAEGRTFAVLGTGVDIPYPPRNRGLYTEIQDQGCILSEYPAGTQPNRAHFPRRNRIIAGLCRAVLVMEAPSRSGALITAYQANDYARDVYVLPGSLDNPRALGCLGLLSRGAQVILNEGHLLDMLGNIPGLDPPVLKSQSSKSQSSKSRSSAVQRSQPSPPANPQPQKPPSNLSKEEIHILKTLQNLCQEQGASSIAFDVLAQNTELPTGSLSGLLLQLELTGVVTQLPGMRYALTG